MSLFSVEVAVAYTRPPTTDDYRYYRVEAASGTEAELVACQWAASSLGVVMPVGSVVYDWEQ